MKKRITLKGIGQVIKESFSFFGQDKIPKLSGSLAYSTVFSIAPFLIVMISLFGIFLGREAMEGKIYEQLNSFFGSGTAAQLQEIIKNASLSGKSKTAAIVGSVILFIGATAIFSEIQDSINSIWGIKPKPKKGWLKFIRNRFLSFSVIIGLGFLLLVSLVVTAMIEAFNEKLQIWFPDISIIIFYILNLIITLAVVALIFGVIFKVLPDADIQWKDVIYGALFTAFLFMLGKFGLTFYISKSNIGSSFGAAGSLVILLVWVYYSSLILYFGAEFTKAWAVKFGEPIRPNDYAVTVKTLDVETGHATIQDKEEKLSEVKTENI